MKKYNGFYLMGNYPDKETFIKSAVEGLKHFDFLEVGVPFSDPIADGETIADAAQVMIESNCGFAEISESIKEIRRAAGDGKDIYIMTYSNLIYNMDMPVFNSFCIEQKVRGLILPDVPSCEKEFIRSLGLDESVAIISFMTPESSDESIAATAKDSGSFIYFISMRGITGGEFNPDKETIRKISLARESATVPVVLGFGIRNRGAAEKAMETGDGFITGTAFIESLNSGGYSGFHDKLQEFFS
ncbi:MAG TPA: tryptophan synthase subunit alpha [Spirochaetota bacterium]|nr:tryptophan synthase subunit alpha [Spirochaetota bacterium]